MDRRNGIGGLTEVIAGLRSTLAGEESLVTDGQIGRLSQGLDELSVRAAKLGDRCLQQEVRRLRIEAVGMILGERTGRASDS